MPSITLNTLPTEIVRIIFSYTFDSDAPMDIEGFLLLRKRLNAQDIVGPSTFVEGLHSSQKEHQLDWVAMNSTCRAIRNMARDLFWTHKTFIMRPEWVAKWIMGPSPLMHEAVSWMQTVIAPMPLEDCEANLEALPWFKFFGNMRDLTIHNSPDRSSCLSNQSPAVTDLTRLQRYHLTPELLQGLRILGLDKRAFTISLTYLGDEKMLEDMLENFVPACKYVTALHEKIVQNYETEMAGIDDNERWAELE